MAQVHNLSACPELDRLCSEVLGTITITAEAGRMR